jgi:hypothetical protein
MSNELPKCKLCGVMKAYEITPSGRSDCDALIVPAGETWKPALDAVESVLESLFLDAEAEGKPWSSIGPVSVRCVEIDERALAALGEDAK